MTKVNKTETYFRTQARILAESREERYRARLARNKNCIICGTSFHPYGKTTKSCSSDCARKQTYKNGIISRAKLRVLRGIPLKERVYRGKRSSRYGAYCRRARFKNLLFLLTRDFFEFMATKPCHYCGSWYEKMGLDRVDNTKGYIEENVVSCCKHCNRMKGVMTKEEFINLCKKVTTHKSQEEARILSPDNRV